MSTPEGWYDDPETPGRQRYWDGSSWTEQRRGAGGADSPTQSPSSPPPSGGMMAPPPSSAAPPPPGVADPPPPSGGMMAPPPGSGPSSDPARTEGATPPGATPPPSATPPPTAPPGSGPPPSSPGAPGPYVPPPSTSTGSRKGLWIGLAVVAVLLVIGAVVVVALVASSGDSATEAVEKNLPDELEANFARQELDVDVTEVDCDDIDGDGSFTVPCRITIDGLSEVVNADVTGTVEGDTVTVTDAQSETNVLDEGLAVKAAQAYADAAGDDVTVVSCTLGEPLVLVRDGLQFTCDSDAGDTATFEVQNGALELIDVS